MIRSVCRRFVPGVIVAVLAFSMPLFAQFELDGDLVTGGNRNALGQYWYVYTSGYGTQQVLVNGTDFTPISGRGDGTGYSAALDFSGLTTPLESAYASIGVGTNISAGDNEGIGSSFSGVTGISFWARGPANLRFKFKVETVENTTTTGTKNDNAHGFDVTIPATNANQWQQYTVNFSQLAQEDWGNTTNPYVFDQTRATKVAWAINANDNRTNVPSVGVFAVSNVRFIGTFDFDPPELCNECVSTTDFAPPTPSALLSNFETSPALRNVLGEYWYGYADSNSMVTADINANEPGRLAGSFAASASFNLASGSSSFAGIGTTLYDETATVPRYLDATNFNTSAVGGIFFEYRTDGTNRVRVELHDGFSAVSDKGEDFHVLLPGTSGAWRSATIPFSRFVLPGFATSRVLDLENLAKLQIVFNTPGVNTITVDNVYFYGASMFDTGIHTLLYNVNNTTFGSLTIDGFIPTLPYIATVNTGMTGPEVTAVPAANYIFVQWSDGLTNPTRLDTAVADTTFTAIFELTSSVASTDRVVKPADSDEWTAVIAPAVITAGEFTVGPNPVSRQADAVSFFWTGRGVESGGLTVYDAAGNVIKSVRVRDSALGNATVRRVVGSWDLTDSRGRQVSEGTYLVKGSLTTVDGQNMKVSAIIGVAQ